jgi:hypothetical protein
MRRAREVSSGRRDIAATTRGPRLGCAGPREVTALSRFRLLLLPPLRPTPPCPRGRRPRATCRDGFRADRLCVQEIRNDRDVEIRRRPAAGAADDQRLILPARLELGA